MNRQLNDLSVPSSGSAQGQKPVSQDGVKGAVSPSPAVRFITIDADDAGQRLDNHLCRVLKGVPKTRVYRIIRKGEVRVNKKRSTADYRLQEGDLLRVPPVRMAEKNEPNKPPASMVEQLEQSVLYEDSKLMVINKPSGLAVHGGSGISCGVIEALRQIRPNEKGLELVHRLDRDTSGCLMVAKKRSMLRYLHAQLQGDGISKIYNALVIGRWPARKQLVNAPLQKNTLRSGERMVRVHVDGKTSRTRYQVLQRLGDATLVEASPLTGRTHQIRVHCLHAGHAILGDEKYGRDEDNRQFRGYGLRRLFLHAARLQFQLPDGEILKIEAPLPDDLQKVLKRLGND
ncbi:23S rRNA pseudouridine(955/2504/2580) synthase RluC [Endozoicomonas sp. Mp262]|uniref:23S rRNA pseudouridine(955/2504/2580) synthase RluC n=1 Tax=Endozoicomonas sp. Mp262 TaxID=2919499 RepID=UPI0021DA73F8